MSAEKFTIGRIARAAGVNIETVRYYQRRGLVGLPIKRARGFRYYTLETAGRVRFIKRAQALGMSLDEVQRLLRLEKKGACQETRSLAAAKLALIEQKLSDLAKLRDALRVLVAACDQPHGTRCPIIEQLEGSRPAAVCYQSDSELGDRAHGAVQVAPKTSRRTGEQSRGAIGIRNSHPSGRLHGSQ